MVGLLVLPPNRHGNLEKKVPKDVGLTRATLFLTHEGFLKLLWILLTFSGPVPLHVGNFRHIFPNFLAQEGKFLRIELSRVRLETADLFEPLKPAVQSLSRA